MAKLYFRHGTVGSAKTLNLLAVAHNYIQQGKKIKVGVPKIDTRFGEGVIKSRAGLERKADFIVGKDCLNYEYFAASCCILLDEAQFLSKEEVSWFRDLTRELNIPVICYGLRTDFRTLAFEGSLRLFELADSIEEIKTVCTYCSGKAIFNLKHSNGIPTITGPSIDLGIEDKYLPACYECYSNLIPSIKDKL